LLRSATRQQPSFSQEGAPGTSLLICFLVLPLLAQTINQDPVIRISVDLVQVDAVVTDAKGRHVANLTRNDFEIVEDGKPQSITTFSFVEGPTSQTPTKPGTLPNDRSATRTEPNLPAPQMLRQTQVQRTIVLVADNLGLAADDIPGVRKAMRSFVENQMRPGDLVSIMTTSGGVGATQQVTNDKRQVYAAIDRVRYVAGRTGQTWYEPVRKIDVASEVENASNRRLNAVRRPFLGSGTVQILKYAIEGLREVQGRKAIVLFSDGFPQSADPIVQLANRASVVIYTLDPRGLASFFLSAVDYCKPPLCIPRREESARESFYRESQKSLDQLARGTGGIFFHDNNDLQQGLANALEDMSSYYLIGYQPQRGDFEPVRGIAKFHKIEVRVLKPGLSVRSRNGFVGVPDAPVSSQTDKVESAGAALGRALRSPFRTDGLPVQLSAFYSASVGKDAKTHGHLTTLRAMLALDAHALQFADAAAGRKALDLEVAAAVYGPDGELVTRSDRKFSLEITASELSEILASGLVYGLDVQIPKPGPYQLRVAAWDASSHRTGSASEFVEIPDFSRSGITLSSLLLSDSDLARNAELVRAGVIGPGNPVTRAFARGAALSYDCTGFGAILDRQTGKPSVEVEIGLFRGAEQVFQGTRMPLAVADGNSSDAIHITGAIRLPQGLPPGDYAVELRAYDRLDKKHPSGVTQWTDFSLVSMPLADSR
jgi:VWFA-related protein